MKNHIVSAFRLTLVMLVVTGIYLAVVYAGSKILPNKGNGEIVYYKGQSFMPISGRSLSLKNIFTAVLLQLIITQQEVEAVIKAQAIKNIWKLYRKEWIL